MKSVRLGILSDLHRTTDSRLRHEWHNPHDFIGHPTRMAHALAWFEQEAIDALVLCGDLTHSGDVEAMSAMLSECRAEREAPVIAVSGNHDVVHGKDVLASEIERANDDHLVEANTAGELVSGVRVASVQLAPASGYQRSRLRALPEVEVWGDEPVVLVSHLPLLSRAAAVAARGMPYPGDLLNRERAVEPLLKRRAPTIVLAGHIHVRDVHVEGPVLQIVQAALVEPPFEAALLDVRIDEDGVLVTRRTRRTSDQRAEFEPILVGPAGSWRFANGSWGDAGSADERRREPVSRRPRDRGSTMNRSDDRILTTHTGSLPRPGTLARQLAASDGGSLTPIEQAALAIQVRDAVAVTVERQADVGIDVICDGEMSKFSYATYVKQRVTGFDGTSEPLSLSEFADFPGIAASGTMRVSNPSCTGPVVFRGEDGVAADITNLKAALEHAPSVEGFMNAASPGIIADYFYNEYYATDEEYLWAIAEAMKPEYDLIAQSGLLLQIDCPDLALGRHFHAKPLDVRTFRARITQRVDALNHALRDIAPERIRMHICWGNYASPHHHDVPLGDIADIVLRARPAALLIEAANPRHSHEWRVFADRTLPEGKILVPGVIDTISTYVEHPRVIADRILRYAAVVGRENVIAGTDCGFATFADSTPVDPDIAWAKLHALSQGAEIASGELWRRKPTAQRDNSPGRGAADGQHTPPEQLTTEPGWGTTSSAPPPVV